MNEAVDIPGLKVFTVVVFVVSSFFVSFATVWIYRGFIAGSNWAEDRVKKEIENIIGERVRDFIYSDKVKQEIIDTKSQAIREIIHSCGKSWAILALEEYFKNAPEYVNDAGNSYFGVSETFFVYFIAALKSDEFKHIKMEFLQHLITEINNLQLRGEVKP